MAEAALRCDGVDHHLERDVLVGVRVVRRLPDPPQHVDERRVTRQVHAQRQRVGEEADEPLQLGHRPAGDRRADDDVTLPAGMREEHVEPGEQHHEEGHPFAAAEIGDRAGELAGPGHLVPRTAERLRRGTWPVRRQLQGRHAGELFGPVAQLRLQLPTLQPGALPARVVDVGERQRVQRGRGALCERAVQRHQLVHDDRHRPAVGDRVVQRHEQRVRTRSEPHEGAPQQRPAREVERCAGLLVNERVESPDRVRLVPEVQLGEGHLVGGQDVLHGIAVDRREAGPQTVVALPQSRESRAERVAVELAVEPEGDRHVVERTVLREPVEEVEPALCVGQRSRGAALRGHDRGTCRLAAEILDADGQVRERRSLEEHPQRKIDAERVTQPGHRAGGEQRVTTQLEEARVTADRGHAEDLRPHVRDRHFERRRGGDVDGVLRVGVRTGAGERAPVDVTVRVERQGVQRHDGRGHQVVGQLATERGAQVGVRGGAGQGDVAGQLAVAGHDHGLPHGGESGQRGLGLRGIGATAVHRQRAVDAAEELQIAGRADPDEIAGAEQAGAGGRCERVRHQSRRGPAGQVPELAGNPGTTDVQLPGHAARDRRHLRVEDVEPGTATGPADRR